MSLLTEIKRRNVFRVAVVYAATAFAVLQGADIMLPNLGVPDWTMGFLTALVLLGFPIALVLAWALELKPDGGLQRTDPSEESRSDKPLLGRRTILVSSLLVVLGIGLSAGWLLKPPTAGPGSGPLQAPEITGADASIAVLPFVNMSGNADNEYFSDGLTETLLHQLAQVPDLKVAARTSSFAFKDRNEDIRTIAGTLGVAHILEGSVQRAGERVRITAQLIQADDGYHLWSEVFDRDLDDIFAVQDEIAGKVTTALRGSLLANAATTNDGGTESTEAYDWYLRGRAALYDRNAERLADAVRAMRRAIALDPEFALAWAGLSEALEQNATFTGQRQEVRDSGEIIESARTAVRLAPGNPQVRVRLAEALLDQTIDLVEPRQQLEQALAVDPNNARGLTAMSVLLWKERKSDQAVDYAERAMTIDPLDWALKVESVSKYTTVGEYEQAERLARSIVDQNPGYVPGLQALGNVYWRTARHSEAYRVYHRLLQINPRTAYVMERIGQSYFALDDLENAERWFDRAASISEDEVRSDRIDIHEIRGETEQVIESLESWIEREQAERSVNELQLLRLESELARAKEDWTRMYELVSQRVERFEAVESWVINFAREDLAVAADRLGMAAERDRLMRANLAVIGQRIENGSRHQYVWLDQARALALMGDAAGAADALQQAVSGGLRSRLELMSAPEFQTVIDDPAIQAVFDHIAELSRTELQRLKAMERELGDFTEVAP